MDTLTAPVFRVQRAAERATFDFGWLQTHHSFSFADYYDPDNLNWGALRVFNDDTVQPGKGFGEHPHRDMEIVTYVLRGELEHKDSMGHHGVVPPGGVQYMSAGTGLTHSEFNHSRENDVHFVQMWVLPKTYGEKPAYGQHVFAEAERTDTWLTIASGEPGVDAPIALRNDATVRVAKLTGGSLEVTLRAGRYGFVFVADGEVSVNGATLAAGDAVRATGAQTFVLHGSAELVAWDVRADRRPVGGRVMAEVVCTHLNTIRPVEPSAPGCEECLKMGDRWVHLRMCLECGHVGCCDSSKNKHATKHFHATAHPIMRSIEPGEHWKWCFVDQVGWE